MMPETALPSDSGPVCPACGGLLSFWFTKHTDSGEFAVRRCGQCRSAFVIPRPDAEALATLYRLGERHELETVDERYARGLDLEKRHPAMTADGRRIAARLRALGAGDRVLDVGAGDGFHSQALAAAAFAVEALEPGATAREVFRRINGFVPMDGFLDEPFVAAHAGRYDAVLLSQVMEHLPDPELAAGYLHRLLRPGGIAVVALPQFRAWLSRLRGWKDMFISPPAYLNFLTQSGLGSLMERSGFSREFAESVTWFDPDRVMRRARVRILGSVAVAGLRAFFALADRAGGGNLLEGYFRKTEGKAGIAP
jgi:SAM-dependent methyltransferase